MTDYERRREKKASALLRKELNEAQLSTLYELQKFGWELKFIRHHLQRGIPVVFDADRKKFAILEPDGRINENPGFDIRH